ncbi:hypothetical protein Lser_V15G34903 [Lactuca serriola]
MVKTRIMTRDQNHNDACSKNRIKSCDLWSDLTHGLIFTHNTGNVIFLLKEEKAGSFMQTCGVG